MRQKGISLILKLVAILLLAGTTNLFGQGVVIGRVVDAKTREGLPGVNVQVLNTVLGASTNLKGAFIIKKVPYGNYTLRITMIGYTRKNIPNVKVAVGDTALVMVRLSESPIEIDPVVVTASKWQEEIEKTAASVEVLTAKEILNRNPIRIEDALETAAGVQVLQENVTIRGSDGYTYGIGSRVLVMIDDVPIMNSDFGKVNWFMVSPTDIERAEIVRGAGSALYGSSAMGGVVNFISRRPSPKSRTFVRAFIGVYDDYHEPDWNWAARADSILHFNRQDFTHSRQFGNLGLRISGGRSYSTGYTDHGEYERFNLSGKLDYRFPNASTLTLFANYMHDDSDVFVFWESQKQASRVNRADRDKHQTQNGLTLFTKYRLPISSKAALEFRVFYNRFLLGTQFADVNFSPALGLGGTVQGNFIPNSSWSIVYGADFKFDKVESDTTFYGKRDAILAAPYFQVDWSMHKNINLTLGGRYDRYEIYSDLNARFSEGRKYEHFSPKVGLNVHPFKNTTVRGAVSNGFKFPVVFQLFFEDEFGSLTLIRNPNLKSEVSWSYELGWRQKITPSWFFEVNGFYTDVENLIEPQPIEQSSRVQFINLPKVRIPGIEVVSNGRWWDNRLGLKLNFIYMNPQDRIKMQLLNYRQKFIAYIAPSLRAGDVEFQVDYKYASAQEHYGTPGIHQLVSQKVLDARIFFYWNQFTFFIGVNNMLNYAYTLRDRFIEENRNFVTGFSAEF